MRSFSILFLAVPLLLAPLALAGCKRSAPAAIVAHGDTFAEMRTIKGEVGITAPGESKRAPYPRERLAEGCEVTLAAGALAWIRRDAGAVWLVEGPAQLTLREDAVKLTSGRAFVDAEDGPPVRIDSPRGSIELSDARASVELLGDGSEDVYVLRGAARAGTSADRATAGERLTLATDGSVKRAPAVAWDDWTGGLATADPVAQPAPFGLGTVGARPPGDKGKPRFSLVIERLDVRVTVDHDFAVTEVDQTFVNPSSDTVEGIFSFRTPVGSVLHKFGVDRDGELVWGKVKESAAAQKQYESNVYQGSTEDPALLSWVAPGVYNARLYPIQAGAKRRVVTRYAEWLSRQGPKADRRLYVYPMAAEGARGSLPRIEEMRVSLDLAKAGASRVRAGMNGKAEGKSVVIQAFDFVPRADLAVELFDGGEPDPVAYRAPHALTAEDIPMNADAKFAAKVSGEEPDYLLVPLRSNPSDAAAAGKGVDLAIVVDTSAATESGALAIARSLTSALLAHLGPDDRAALWAGDATLRPVSAGSGELVAVDASRRREWLSGLASVERGGATDLGALLTEAASRLDTKRHGAVLYIGDGLASVGEVSSKALRERMLRLPPATRIFTAGVGSRANMALLDSISRGTPAESVGDAYGAARAALRLLEAAQRPAWVGATVDLGSGIERVLPRELPPVGADETVLVVGRISGKLPKTVELKSGETALSRPLHVVAIEDAGDLRRRWGQGRMQELLGEGAGRAALVDIGRRYGLVSPYTSLYVPTAREAAQGNGPSDEARAEARAEAIERRRWWRPWSRAWKHEDSEPLATSASADNKEGGTGTRAKGEEGSMGNPRGAGQRFGVQGPREEKPADIKNALREAQEFGMIGLLNAPAGGDPNAPAAPWGRDQGAAPEAAKPAAPAVAAALSSASDGRAARGNLSGDEVGDAFGAGGLGLAGAGEGGGGKGGGIGLGTIGSLGHGAGAGTGQGFGSGSGRLGGAHATKSPVLRQGAVQVNGRLPPEVIQRIVRQNFGRFRLCYENGLRTNPNLSGKVAVQFVIDRAGAVATAKDGGSDLPDGGVVSCVVRGFGNLSFPQPEGGVVSVTYPVVFSPGDDGAPTPNAAAAAKVSGGGPIGIIGHSPRPCGVASELPLSERRILWSERLATQGSADGSLAVYRRALEDCEAPTWRERTTLLLLMVDQLRSVTARVALWKSLILTPAADVVYRAIVVRVQNVAELHELHRALGLQSVDPDLLAGMVAKAKTPAERLGVLRAAATKWPDDLELGLRVLDAHEDAADDAGGRAWARRLRRRADATAHVWTSVGEYYLRVASREAGEGADRDRIEARRTFGELVEFAPDDPAARRRLGDLLRAHGWYEEALRQYLTLQTLTPDDPTVPLLIATAAQGLGRVEEAVGWAEKASAAGSPDGKSALSRAARATAAVFLAWAREDALRTGKKEDAEKLLARARRLVAANAKPGGVAPGAEQGVRILVTWSHPELHPSLWTTSLGTPMPSPDNFPVFGVAEAQLATAPATVELRLEPDDAARAARLGLKAVVTVITGLGTPNEKIARQEVGFGTVAAPSPRLVVSFAGGALRVGAP
ncbi:MAG TPA: AgmX/PglI C-terminal domain-containing protein [Labilithrix sp.]|nr:AgmX/PglI C-terminal domain-containing protein [Labilithrix sp.]